MKHKHLLYSYGFLFIIAILAILTSYFSPSLELIPLEELRDLMINSKILGFFIFTLLIILSVPFPIPSTPITLAGGYVYGTFLGSIVALVAVTLGGALSFFLIRRYGRPLLEKLVDKHHIVHFNHIIKKKGLNIALVVFAIPLFPSDAVTLILGLTNIRFTTFILLTVLGHIPRYLILTSLGNDLYAGFSQQSIITIALAVIFIIIAIFREKIKRLIFKGLPQF